MSNKTIRTQTITTRPVSGFTPDVQRAFAAIGQHIDFLLNAADERYVHKGYNGSDSWIPSHVSDDKVILKTFPWDERFREMLDLPSGDTEGVGVLVRDEFLRPSDMRCLWDAYGKAYSPSPTFPLYDVRPQEGRGKDFQLLIWVLGPGCDVFALPGVSETDLDVRIATRSGSGEIIVRREENDGMHGAVKPQPGGVTPQTANLSASTSLTVVPALKRLVRRARV